MLTEDGAKTVIVPIDNVNEIADIPATILGSNDVPFYQNNITQMQKALLHE